MTAREAAIISCYTGYFIGDLGEIYKYLSELTGQSVYTHEIPTIIEVYKRRIKEDFINITINNKDVAQKPTKKKTQQYWHCPICKAGIIYGDNFCVDCGQRIYWSRSHKPTNTNQ